MEGLVNLDFLRRVLEQSDPLPDPAHHRHGHRVPEGAVAGSVGGELAPTLDGGVAVGEALQPLALDRGQTPDLHDGRLNGRYDLLVRAPLRSIPAELYGDRADARADRHGNQRCTASGSVLACVETFGAEGVGHDGRA